MAASVFPTPRCAPLALSSSSSLAPSSTSPEAVPVEARASPMPSSRPRPSRRAARQTPSPARARCPSPRACACSRNPPREAIEDPLELIPPASPTAVSATTISIPPGFNGSENLDPPSRSVNLSEFPTGSPQLLEASDRRSPAEPIQPPRLERPPFRSARGERGDEILDHIPDPRRPPPDLTDACLRSSRGRSRLLRASRDGGRWCIERR